MSGDKRKALAVRRDLIEQRADAILDQAVSEGQEWTLALGEKAAEQRSATRWRRQARTVAAYRDRYGVTSRSPLGAAPDSDAQKIDSAQAKAALSTLRRVTEPQSEPEIPTSQVRAGRSFVR